MDGPPAHGYERATGALGRVGGGQEADRPCCRSGYFDGTALVRAAMRNPYGGPCKGKGIGPTPDNPAYVNKAVSVSYGPPRAAPPGSRARNDDGGRPDRRRTSTRAC